MLTIQLDPNARQLACQAGSGPRQTRLSTKLVYPILACDAKQLFTSCCQILHKTGQARIYGLPLASPT